MTACPWKTAQIHISQIQSAACTFLNNMKLKNKENQFQPLSQSDLQTFTVCKIHKSLSKKCLQHNTGEAGVNTNWIVYLNFFFMLLRQS